MTRLSFSIFALTLLLATSVGHAAQASNPRGNNVTPQEPGDVPVVYLAEVMEGGDLVFSRQILVYANPVMRMTHTVKKAGPTGLGLEVSSNPLDNRFYLVREDPRVPPQVTAIRTYTSVDGASTLRLPEVTRRMSVLATHENWPTVVGERLTVSYRTLPGGAVEETTGPDFDKQVTLENCGPLVPRDPSGKTRPEVARSCALVPEDGLDLENPMDMHP